MAALNRRLQILEEQFGPVVVEALAEPLPEPTAAAVVATTQERYQRMLAVVEWVNWLRWACDEGVAVPEIGDVDAVRAAIRRLQRLYCPGLGLGPYCETCDTWMSAIAFDPDGRTYRCSACGCLAGFLPYRHCNHAAHNSNQCGFDWAAAVREQWFWLLLSDADREAVLGRAA